MHLFFKGAGILAGMLFLLIQPISCMSTKDVARDTARVAGDLVNDGDYERALKLYQNSSDAELDSEIQELYLKLADRIRRAGDRAFEKNDFARAGGIYNNLLKSGIAAQAPAGRLSFTSDYLKRQIDICSRTLTDTGIMRYREEKLDQAIVIWERVLEFDPGNEAVIKAVATANKQLQRLKDIN